MQIRHYYQDNKQKSTSQHEPRRQISQTYSTVPIPVYLFPSHPQPIYPTPSPPQYCAISQVHHQGDNATAFTGTSNSLIMMF